MEGINITEVKQFNAELKALKEQSARLNAQIEFNEAELKNRCAELSSMLGIEVTPENIRQVYEEYVQKVNTALTTGKAILNKIKNEKTVNEQSESSMSPQVNVQSTAGLSSGMVDTLQMAGQQAVENQNNLMANNVNTMSESVFNQQTQDSNTTGFTNQVVSNPVEEEEESSGPINVTITAGHAANNSMIAAVSGNNGIRI